MRLSLWANVVRQSIHNAAAPRSAGSSEVLHTTVHLAVYDAVVAIAGGAQPFALLYAVRCFVHVSAASKRHCQAPRLAFNGSAKRKPV